MKPFFTWKQNDYFIYTWVCMPIPAGTMVLGSWPDNYRWWCFLWYGEGRSYSVSAFRASFLVGVLPVAIAYRGQLKS